MLDRTFIRDPAFNRSFTVWCENKQEYRTTSCNIQPI